MKKTMIYTAKKQNDIMLNANESYRNIDDDILQVIAKEIVNIQINRYPDATSRELIETYAAVCGFHPNQILAGNGSDEMLGLLISRFLGKGKRLYTLAPDFSMYDYYASQHEANVITFACEKDGSFVVEDFIEYGRQQHIDMIIFSNPNNPTGHMLHNKQICEILEAFPRIPVIVDEAYGEFANESMLAHLQDYTNLYVTRTLSKAYGLAGARLGFLLSDKENIKVLKNYLVPYNISSIDQVIGTVVLRHAKRYIPYIMEICEARDTLFEHVKCMERITFYPSQANYLFARTKHKAELLALFEKQHIAIRNYEDDSIRITIGSKEENTLVYHILKEFEYTKEEATL